MGLLATAFEKRFLLKDDPPEWFMRAFGYASDAGVMVNAETSLQVSAFYSGVRIIAGDVASLPLFLYRRMPDGSRQKAADHPLFEVIHSVPNPEMTSFELREALMGHVLVRGNAYAYINADGGARIRELWPLRPDKMRVERQRMPDGTQGPLVYNYQFPSSVGGFEAPIPAASIWHIHGMGFDGVSGYSPIAFARNALGLALATEKFGAKFFGNGARPGVVLKHPKTLSEKAKANIRESWYEEHGGIDRSHLLAVLEEGMEVDTVGMAPDEAQFLETRKFQVAEIARMLNLPPHKLGDLERATFSNIEQQSLDYVIGTLRAWLVRIEQSIALHLMSPAERKKLYAEHKVDALLRGNMKDRHEAYQTAILAGWMSRNDVRTLENLNKEPGLDEYLVPLNMIPASAAGGARSVELTMQDGKPVYRILPSQEESRAASDEAAANSAAMRRRMAEAQIPLFEQMAGRIVRKEVNDVRKAARDAFKVRDINTFHRWLETYYAEHKDFIKREMTPLIHSYGQMVVGEAAKEVGGDGEWTPQFDQFVHDYVESHADMHIGSSVGQIKSVVGHATEQGDDPVEALDERLDEWEERRPSKMASQESYQSNNALARAAYVAFGVTRLRWNSTGKSCPYCNSLDGAIVGIEFYFVGDGDSLQPDGADRPLPVSRNTFNPPLHAGCDCMITAG